MSDELMVLPASVLLHARRLSNKRGHAAPPGTGPEGETCGSCVHLDRRQMARRTSNARWSGRVGPAAMRPTCAPKMPPAGVGKPRHDP